MSTTLLFQGSLQSETGSSQISGVGHTTVFVQKVMSDMHQS